MVKKPIKEAVGASSPEPQTLGDYLAYIRGMKKLTLREVEEATEKQVSNAYLSQLENNKIARPSPNVLHSLAALYAIPYDRLMEKAGYVSPSPSGGGVLRSGGGARHGRVATFANDNLTDEEEEKLIEYLAFLRSRRGIGGKT